MGIFVGSDYRGLERKNELVRFLTEQGFTVADLGTYEPSPCDFNDAAVAVAKNVREDFGSFGILICDSAHGMTIQANRFKGIRATYCPDEESAKLAREHEDANILCMAAHSMDLEKMKNVASVFLGTPFENIKRRVRRINRLDEREDYD